MPTELAHESPPSPSGTGRRLLGKLSRTSPPEAATPDGAQDSDEPKLDGASTATTGTLLREAGGETPETPTLLAGKYATVEQLEQAYVNLQRELGRLRNELGQERKDREDLELYLQALLDAGGLPQPPAAPAGPVLTEEQKTKVVDALAAVHGIPTKEETQRA